MKVDTFMIKEKTAVETTIDSNFFNVATPVARVLRLIVSKQIFPPVSHVLELQQTEMQAFKYSDGPPPS